jgi:hypothetical protein
MCINASHIMASLNQECLASKNIPEPPPKRENYEQFAMQSEDPCAASNNREKTTKQTVCLRQTDCENCLWQFPAYTSILMCCVATIEKTLQKLKRSQLSCATHN